MPDSKTFTLSADSEVPMTLNPLDRDGGAEPVENATWSSSDPTVVGLEVAADGLSAMLVTTGKPGVATVTVTADAQIGDGIAIRTETAEITVSAELAETLNLSFGLPQLRSIFAQAPGGTIITTGDPVAVTEAQSSPIAPQ